MLTTAVLVPTFMRWLHLLAAITWVGGTIFVAVVLAPLLRRELPPRERLHLVSLVGRRFNIVGWIALGLLLATGSYNSLYKLGNIFSTPSLLTGSFYGRLLLVKLVTVAVVVFLTWLHSYRLAPKLEAMAATETEPGPATITLQHRLIRISSLHLLLNLVIVFIAAWMTTIS